MILGIVGSPRKGSNSEFIARKILEGIESEVIVLAELNIEQFTEDDRGYGDDMPDLVDKIKSADGVLFVCPSYFSNVPGILKNFMDRTNPQWFSKEFKGQKAAVVALGGGFEASIEKAADAIEEYCRIQEIEVVGRLVLNTQDREPGEHPQKFMEKVEDFGKSLKGKLF